jgi:hypothetical protein
MTNDVHFYDLRNLNNKVKGWLIETRNTLQIYSINSVEKIQIIGRMLPEEVLSYFKNQLERKIASSPYPDPLIELHINITTQRNIIPHSILRRFFSKVQERWVNGFLFQYR